MAAWRSRIGYASERGYFSLRDSEDIQRVELDELSEILNYFGLDYNEAAVQNLRTVTRSKKPSVQKCGS